jgi:hypothetical protein
LLLIRYNAVVDSPFQCGFFAFVIGAHHRLQHLPRFAQHGLNPLALGDSFPGEQAVPACVPATRRRSFAVASRCNFNFWKDLLPAIAPKRPLSGRAMGVLQIA